MRAWLAAILLLWPALPAAAAETLAVGGFRFAVPAGWQVETPTSPMREAQLGVPNPAGAPGEVSFFHFGSGRGGTPEANIERWYGQFQEPREALGAEVTRDIVGATVVHRFRASGTYLSGMPGGPRTPQPGTTLLATVLESDTGHVFVRFVAPTPLAQATAEDFAAMVEGAARR